MKTGIKYGILILAAGNSSRLGEPKQLLTYKNNSLLANVVGQASLISETKILVVTGAKKELIQPILVGMNVEFIENPQWETGMGSSIAVGTTAILENCSSLESIIITVCDQPHVSASTFHSLIEAFNKENKGMVASRYENTFGTPVLFGATYFDVLKELKGHEGAKKILQQNLSDTIYIDFPRGIVDIDTKEDYQNLLDQ